MKRHLVIGSIAALLVLAVPLFAVWIVRRPVPPLDGTHGIGGLSSSATVSFDGRAIPYIEARSDSDAYLAQGYITARDRLFQMDMLRRAALGQMSEIFGASWLPGDRMSHTLGIKHLAYSEFNNLSAPSKSALESYARGINEYITEASDNLPLQFVLLGYKPQMWHGEDSLAILKYDAYLSDESWRLDDFRQRVSNKTGEDIANQLFADTLLTYGLPAQNSPGKPKEASVRQTETDSTSGKTKESAQTSKKESKPSTSNPTNPTHTNVPRKAPVKRTAPEGEGRIDSGALPADLRDAIDPLLARVDADCASVGDSPLKGSTTWAVPARASVTGGAMLACNTDGQFTSPSGFYLCSLNSPGLHVAGASIPGVPGIMIGRNENICWGRSLLKADVQDIFLEQFKSQFDSSYRTDKGWAEAEVDTDLIPVRFGSDVEHKVLRTQHGPVLFRNGQSAVSLTWSGADSSKPAFDSIYKMNRAASIDEFVKAAAEFRDPPVMFVLADRFGNIACHGAGALPVRTGGDTGTKLNVGWQVKGAWEGVVPFEKLPSAVVAFSTSSGAPRNPIVAANQKPSTQDNALPKLSDNDVLIGHQFAAPYRANRLLSAITQSTTAISLADMVALTGDQFTPIGAILADALSDAAASTRLVDRNGNYSIEMLKRWDGQVRTDGIEGSVYESYMQAFTRRLVEPHLGRAMTTEYMQRWPMWLAFSQSVLQHKPQKWLAPDERTYDCFLLTTLSQALKSLHVACDTGSPPAWTWGRLHHAVFDQLGGSAASWLNGVYRLGPIPVGGTPECIDSCDVMFDNASVHFTSTYGPTQRMICDMSDRDKFYQSIETGESGQLTSDHRHDQIKSWASADLLPIAFSPDQLMKQTQHKLTLSSE